MDEKIIGITKIDMYNYAGGIYKHFMFSFYFI